MAAKRKTINLSTNTFSNEDIVWRANTFSKKQRTNTGDTISSMHERERYGASDNRGANNQEFGEKRVPSDIRRIAEKVSRDLDIPFEEALEKVIAIEEERRRITRHADPSEPIRARIIWNVNKKSRGKIK